ncbi:uncharacterized protein ColSpa_00587 [Colletotrichum spaethianum]|uniref:MYND-type zinc finger protein samB n=1 Tax=Colletotrichum spaethianum TaxID=700344 RepID=A0AA37L1U2_9PEZI|nr:uncharacterized protein ColSpa_00587 [Colletotrichum spaethianum]GKT40406.1 hypothetical protein ColSpa_00587 [Colletotrichum spaethianum]
MGRWGYRMMTTRFPHLKLTDCLKGLFEADIDIDIACELDDAFVSREGAGSLRLSRMINQTDMLAPPGARAYQQTEEYRLELDNLIVNIRNQLDSGLGDKLFDKYRALENEFLGQYRIILVGALMMRAGAKIKKENFQHLRDLVPQIDCQHGYTLPINDLGFRGPGKAQFLAALDNYRPGTPRNYEEPSCFHCGKDCQKAHWKVHKPSCKPMCEVTFLNV